ncbi:MAG: type II toxin-antitoxin system RelE family toxin [Bdellovibrio bacteriovorus]
MRDRHLPASRGPAPCRCDQALRRGAAVPRTGDYRAVYQIKDARLLVLVVRVGHRREVYR